MYVVFLIYFIGEPSTPKRRRVFVKGFSHAVRATYESHEVVGLTYNHNFVISTEA